MERVSVRTAEVFQMILAFVQASGKFAVSHHQQQPSRKGFSSGCRKDIHALLSACLAGVLLFGSVSVQADMAFPERR